MLFFFNTSLINFIQSLVLVGEADRAHSSVAGHVTKPIAYQGYMSKVKVAWVFCVFFVCMILLEPVGLHIMHRHCLQALFSLKA